MSQQQKTQVKLCSLCGQPIAPARLEALPGVTTCIVCAKKHPRKVDTSNIELSQASQINRNGFAPYD
jgi:RNA polymerase-binding transcription factor DksA